jgi:hypothetical protein
MTLKDFRRTPNGRILRRQFREIEYLVAADSITRDDGTVVHSAQIDAWAMAALRVALTRIHNENR